MSIVSRRKIIKYNPGLVTNKRLVLFLLLIFAIALIIRFTRTPLFGPLDLKLFYLINAGIKNPFFDFILPIFSLNWLIFALFGIFFIYIFVNKGVKISLVFLIIFILMMPLGLILKKTANLNRPYAGLSDVYYYDHSGQWVLVKQANETGKTTRTSFPSGHTLRFFVLVGFFWMKRKIRDFLLAFGFLVMLSRVYTGAHYPSDTLIGAFTGAYLGFLVHKIAIL